MSKSTNPSPHDLSLTAQIVSDSLALMGRAMIFGALVGASLSTRDLETIGAALIHLHDRLTPASAKKEDEP